MVDTHFTAVVHGYGKHAKSLTSGEIIVALKESLLRLLGTIMAH
jgi:hypothetical protein